MIGYTVLELLPKNCVSQQTDCKLTVVRSHAASAPGIGNDERNPPPPAPCHPPRAAAACALPIVGSTDGGPHTKVPFVISTHEVPALPIERTSERKKGYDFDWDMRSMSSAESVIWIKRNSSSCKKGNLELSYTESLQGSTHVIASPQHHPRAETTPPERESNAAAGIFKLQHTLFDAPGVDRRHRDN
ncbi:hypothetical protein EVAR_60231_1 [Eumeta japonica]|uniref:Uncharacterized protein n=1 Tax=Eumeta variegata TaxID=151549 RepID=A0A4C1Z1R5_EUMVA|nr:hypothetical protein EVAR_60231_1 [Eumeta japonica]